MSYTYNRQVCNLGHEHKVDRGQKCDAPGCLTAADALPFELTVSDPYGSEPTIEHACSARCLRAVILYIGAEDWIEIEILPAGRALLLDALRGA